VFGEADGGLQGQAAKPGPQGGFGLGPCTRSPYEGVFERGRGSLEGQAALTGQAGPLASLPPARLRPSSAGAPTRADSDSRTSVTAPKREGKKAGGELQGVGDRPCRKLAACQGYTASGSTLYLVPSYLIPVPSFTLSPSTSFTLYPVPSFALYPVPSFTLYLVTCTLYPVPCTLLPYLVLLYLAHCTLYLVPCTFVRGTWYFCTWGLEAALSPGAHLCCQAERPNAPPASTHGPGRR